MAFSSFRLLAPRSKKFIDQNFFIEGMLFYDEAKKLVDLLAIPIRPPNLAIPKAIRSLNSTKQLPPRNTRSQTRKGTAVGNEIFHTGSQVGAHSSIGQGLTLSKFPVDMLSMIFSHLDVEDVVRFALTNSYFWAIGRGFVHAYSESTLGQWAGQNLVFVNQHNRPKDYPPGLFSPEEVEERSPLKNPSVYELKEKIDSLRHGLYDLAFADVSDGQGWSEGPQIQQRLKRLCNQPEIRDEPILKLVRKEIIADGSPYYPKKHEWMLRNLTTKEFVYAKALSNGSGRNVHGIRSDLFNLGAAVIVRTCWSVTSVMWMADMWYRNGKGIGRGVWAGHRFDITTIPRHRAETAEGEMDQWKDVSEELADELQSHLETPNL